MSKFAITLNLEARGNILPKTFVKGDPANAFGCLQAGASDVPIGVSGVWDRYPAGTPSSDGYEVVSGEFPEVNGMGSIVPLTLGAACNAFDYLGPDASGKGVPGNVPAAIALEAGAADEDVRVFVLPPRDGSGGIKTLAGSATLTAADSGKLIVATTADSVITLPAGVPGLKFKVITANATAATGGSVGTTVDVPGTDTLNGNGFTAAAGKGAVNTDASAVIGDFLEVTCTAANTWFITAIKGTWAREA